ncbi:MAG: hypothetical protein K1T65_03925 [Candidatus Aramenus sp.]|nr:hypothetical protein [Candidatus Aramenus sp.]
MKKIVREVSSIIRKANSGVIVLPGLSFDVWYQLFKELDEDFILVTRDPELESAKDSLRVSRDFVGGSKKYVVDLSYLLEIGHFRLPRNAACIVEAPSRSLVLRNKLLRVYHSEDLIREKYLPSFKVIRYFASRRLPQSRAFKERVEKVKEIYERFSGFTVVAPNSKERDMLRDYGIKAVTDLREVKDNRVILSREITTMPAYLYLRNKLWGGVLVDLTNTTMLYEEWEKVRLGELGFYKLSQRDFKGYDTEQLNSVKGFSLKLEEEFNVTPRRDVTKVKLIGGKVLAGGRELGELYVTKKRVNLNVKCKEETLYSSAQLSLGYFLFPQSSGRCSVFTACMEVEKNRDLCLRMSFEAFLLSRDYVEALKEIDLKKAASSVVSNKVVKEATRGKETVEVKLLDLSYVFELSREDSYIKVLCVTCNKGLRVRIRGDIESTKRVLVDAIYGILKTEVP